MHNWMTTLAGLGAVMTAVGTALTGVSHGDWSSLSSAIPAVIAGIGLIAARDSNK